MTAKIQGFPTRSLPTRSLPARSTQANTARFYQQGFLQRDAVISLSAETTHHARNVLRLHEGEQMRLFNKEHGEWLVEIVSWETNEKTKGEQKAKQRAKQREEQGKSWQGKSWLEKSNKARCLHCLRPAHEGEAEQSGATLYFSPIRAHRLVWLLSGAVELGVSRLVPFRSSYTNAYFSHARAQKTIQAAVEQSERLTCPLLEEEQPLSAALVKREPQLLFCAERGETTSLQKTLDEHTTTNTMTNNMAMLVGPEGGFSEAEHAMLRRCRSVVAVSLGARVLRCETAALAVLACWQTKQASRLEQTKA